MHISPPNPHVKWKHQCTRSPKCSPELIIKNYKILVLTFPPDTGSMTGSSSTACFRNTLPLVARNIIRSKAMDLSLGTSPVRNPNLTCLDESVVISYTKSIRNILSKRKPKKFQLYTIEHQVKFFTCSISKGVSNDSSPVCCDRNSICWAVLSAEWKNSPAWRKQ